MDLKKELRDLENKGAFIHLNYEHYHDGTNCLFSIEFKNFKDKNDRTLRTGWYGDNHEFGDVVNCVEVAILFANWLLEDDHLQWYFYTPKKTMTEQNHSDFLKSIKFKNIAADKIFKEFNKS